MFTLHYKEAKEGAVRKRERERKKGEGGRGEREREREEREREGEERGGREKRCLSTLHT